MYTALSPACRGFSPHVTLVSFSFVSVAVLTLADLCAYSCRGRICI
jgi:hypothetical protein